MDAKRFDAAKKLYDATEYRDAAREFLASVDPDTTVGNGPAYHLAGNSLLRLKRFGDAAKVYELALADEAYDKRSAIEFNLATTYLQEGDYAAAVTHYARSLDESDATSPYRANTGMGKALLKQGRYEDAAIAYRRAVLDETNPDPGKSLVSLGVCLAAAGKPEDAISAYRSALGIATFTGRDRALVNLGFAYHAVHQWNDAILSFEEAHERYGAELSAEAAAALAHARASLRGATELPAGETGPTAVLPEVDSMPVPSDLPPLQGITLEQPDAHAAVASSEPTGAFQATAAETTTGSLPALGDPIGVEDYFQMSEKEAARRGREAARASRSPFALLKGIIVTVLIVGVIGGAGAWAWVSGFGVPTGADAVRSLMVAYNTGKPLESLWLTGSTNITREMAQIPAGSDYSAGKVTFAGLTGSVDVTVTPESGDPISFTFDIAREGIGWKVSNIEPVVP